jgi:hypothetical protein
MTYNKLIETISEIAINPKINKKGLTLVYELPNEEHLRMNQELFIMMNPINNGFEPNDEFEVEVDGILIKFIKKN